MRLKMTSYLMGLNRKARAVEITKFKEQTMVQTADSFGSVTGEAIHNVTICSYFKSEFFSDIQSGAIAESFCENCS